MPAASAVRRSPRVASLANSARRCSPRTLSECASSAFHAGCVVSGNRPVVIPVISSSPIANRAVDEPLGLVHERIEMRLTLEALRVDLVDVFGAGWPRREPSARGHDLQTADSGVVARSSRQLGGDWLAREHPFLDVFR